MQSDANLHYGVQSFNIHVAEYQRHQWQRRAAAREKQLVDPFAQSGNVIVQ